MVSARRPLATTSTGRIGVLDEEGMDVNMVMAVSYRCWLVDNERECGFVHALGYHATPIATICLALKLQYN